MNNRRSMLSTAFAAGVAVISCRRANANDSEVKPLFLHVYSSNRFSTFDEDKQNRKRTRSSSSEWIRVVTFLITPNTQIYIRLPGAHDPDITVDGRVERREGDRLQAALKIAWSDSYIREQHELSGLITEDEIHSSSTIYCRYIFSHLKDPYDSLDRVIDKR